MAPFIERFLPHTPRRSWKITLISAQHLQYVRKFGKMKVYAVVSENGKRLGKTVADTKGKTNPQWNYSFMYQMRESDSNSTLVVKLYCKRSRGKKFVCEAKIRVKELVEKWWRWSRGGELLLDLYNENYPGTYQGKLKISYSSST